jgi:hypothetical protein
LRKESLARRKSARLICVSGSSSWPIDQAPNWNTPRAQSGGNHKAAKQRGGTDSLSDQTKNWKTPHGMCNTDRFGKTAGGGGEFAKQAMAWPTPSVPGGGRSLSTAEILAKGATAKGKRQVGLENVAKNWPTPNTPSGGPNTKSTAKHTGGMDLEGAVVCFRPDQPTSKPGANTSDGTPRLNPRFVESLMGLPPGWTDSGHAAMVSFLSWRATHSAALQQLLRRDAIAS